LIPMVKEIMAFLIRFSGLHWIIRELICRNKITIIVYHDPSPKALECHLSYLCKRYHFISLKNALDAIYMKNLKELPPKSLVVTIDDGHAGNYSLLKIFKRYGVRPTIYLSSHMVDTHRHFWSRIVKEPASHFKKTRHHQLLFFLENNYGFMPDREYPSRQTLSRQEIAEMNPWVDFQSHGRYHFNLITCDEETAKYEIMDSKHKIEEMLGRNCEHFAYPFGDYSERDVKLVKDSGYKSGRTTDPGFNDAHSDPYRLKVIAMIPDNASKNMLCAQMSSLPSYMAYLVNHKRWPGGL
jgi:poly-beta-1,6-N-acetyl-D-glucosamine N-deacetylase